MGWHITTPIINSRSGLSFLLHPSPFLLTAPFFCSHLFPWLLHLYSPSTLFLDFSVSTIIPSYSAHDSDVTVSNDHHSCQKLTYFRATCQDLARRNSSKWKHNGVWRWSGLKGSDVSAQQSRTHTVTKTLKSTGELHHFIEVSNQKTSRIDLLLPTLTLWLPSPLFPTVAFSLIVLSLYPFIPPTFYLIRQLSESFFPFLSTLHLSSLLRFIYVIYFILLLISQLSGALLSLITSKKKGSLFLGFYIFILSFK